MRIPVVIPAYEPDENLLDLCRSLVENHMEDIIIIDDGSGEQYIQIFEIAQKQYHCTILKHAVNMGKGRALKNAFNVLLNERSDLIGCVTADSDGQHTAEDISKCIKTLEQYQNCLILGCRDFNLPDVPFKSSFGNKLTSKICRWLCNISVSDTQTGLRAIPKKFMELLLNTKGERFEFETNMLIESKDKFEIKEVGIETIYDSKTEHKTHFDPIKDSIRIYKIFGGIFLKFIISSLSSCVLDIVLFSIFCSTLVEVYPFWYVSMATVFARTISATYNYLINYSMVFKSSEKHSLAAIKYFGLAICQMCLSALLTTVGVRLFYFLPEVSIKIVVDTMLFFISYRIQNTFVFRC